jgi:hypothetical protein
MRRFSRFDKGRRQQAATRSLKSYSFTQLPAAMIGGMDKMAQFALHLADIGPQAAPAPKRKVQHETRRSPGALSPFGRGLRADAVLNI